MKTSKIKLFILFLIIQEIKNENLQLGAKCQNNDGSELRLHGTTTQKSVTTKRPRPVVTTPRAIKQVTASSTNEANNHEFPHQALVGYDNNNPIAMAPKNEINWLCGGSLISSKFVLTAVQCLNLGWYGSPKFVNLGMLNLHGDKLGLTYGIKSTHQHPGYNKDKQANDVGLLELNDTVNLNEFICSACLPTAAMIQSQVLVTGFAHENYDGNHIEYLLKYEVNKKSDDECKRINDKIVDTTNLSCYSHASEKIKKCGVTEGSPLQILNADQSKCPYTQVGVVGLRSYGCENIKYYSTNIYSNVDWIKELVGGDEELNKISCNVRIK